MNVIQGFCRTQRRQRQRSGLVAYKYRGLPCNVRPDAEMWYVAGQDGNGGGILEWCYDEGDAKDRLRLMQRFPQFKNLRIGSNAEDNAKRAAQIAEEMKFKPAVISGAKVLILEIDRSMKIEPIEDNPNGYTITKGDIWHTFTSHFEPSAGDVIVRNPDNPLRTCLLHRTDFDAHVEKGEQDGTQV